MKVTLMGFVAQTVVFPRQCKNKGVLVSAASMGSIIQHIVFEIRNTL